METRRSRRGLPAVLLGVVVAGGAACGDDGGNPVAPTTPVVDARSDEDAARRSVDAWLSLIEAGSYAEAYAATGALFRQQVTADEFRSTFEERRATLGALVGARTSTSTTRTTTLPDVPAGDYFVFEFDADFELRPNTGERVTAASESNEWRVVGYYLVR